MNVLLRTERMTLRRFTAADGLSLIRTFFEEWPEYIEGAEQGDVEYAITRETWAHRNPRT
ncbi:hypothetical protein ACWCXH_29565 [Kitasatospora sp. NPDC001660]